MLATSTLSFLRSLAKHNDRGWFEEHRKSYESAKSDTESLLGDVIRRLGAIDEDVAGHIPRQCLFRIHRDVRFSKDKAPYKTHLGAYLSKGGRKSNLSGYYLHIEPGASFAAGGLWMPMAPELARVRQEIDYCFEEFRSILTASPFRKRFGDLRLDEEVKLTRMPKGYEVDNPAADYLRLKSFIASYPLTDAMLTEKKASKTVSDAFCALTPLVRFLNRAVEE